MSPGWPGGGGIRTDRLDNLFFRIVMGLHHGHHKEDGVGSLLTGLAWWVGGWITYHRRNLGPYTLFILFFFSYLFGQTNDSFQYQEGRVA